MIRILGGLHRRRHARLNRRVREADALEEDGCLREARAVYEQALSQEPKNAAALLRLANLAQRGGSWQEAESLWQRLVEVRPERADANHQLARLRLRTGKPAEALSFAERAVQLAPPGRPHEIAHRARNLRDHLLREPTPFASRHVAIGGMSFCGSTLLGFLLGSLPDVANIGESHSLVFRQLGGERQPVDYTSDPPEGMIPCDLCADDPCPVWSLPFRRSLAADPVDWYGKLAEQAKADVLVSSDKSHAKLSGLDPLGRHDLIVLFKSPAVAWASARRRPRPPKEPMRYLTRWEREYGRLLHDLPHQGRRVVLHFDAFRRAPEPHLRRLLELLELPIPAGHELLRVDPTQHVMGGNTFTRRDVQSKGEELTIRPKDTHEVPTDHVHEIQDRADRSLIYRELLAEHAQAFQGCEG